LNLVDKIPTELITLTGNDYAGFVLAVETIKHIVDYWKNQGAAITLSRMRGYDAHPLRFLYESLRRCPDEAPAMRTSELGFIDDAELRESIRADLSAAHSDYANGEWKSSTVMAGSVIEALLLWALSRVGEREAMRIAGLERPLNTWRLQDYINAAERLHVIDAESARQAQLSNDFRNLIHPGREQRLQRRCTKGTALGALAGAEKVVEALSRRARTAAR
jgi:hypothetical protein